jgi:hypothetical protein
MSYSNPENVYEVLGAMSSPEVFTATAPIYAFIRYRVAPAGAVQVTTAVAVPGGASALIFVGSPEIAATAD